MLFFQYVNVRYQLDDIFLREAGKRIHHRGVSILPNSNAVLSRSNYVLNWLVTLITVDEGIIYLIITLLFTWYMVRNVIYSLLSAITFKLWYKYIFSRKHSNHSILYIYKLKILRPML